MQKKHINSFKAEKLLSELEEIIKSIDSSLPFDKIHLFFAINISQRSFMSKRRHFVRLIVKKNGFEFRKFVENYTFCKKSSAKSSHGFENCKKTYTDRKHKNQVQKAEIGKEKSKWRIKQGKEEDAKKKRKNKQTISRRFEAKTAFIWLVNLNY